MLIHYVSSLGINTGLYSHTLAHLSCICSTEDGSGDYASQSMLSTTGTIWTGIIMLGQHMGPNVLPDTCSRLIIPPLTPMANYSTPISWCQWFGHYVIGYYTLENVTPQIYIVNINYHYTHEGWICSHHLTLVWHSSSLGDRLGNMHKYIAASVSSLAIDVVLLQVNDLQWSLLVLMRSHLLSSML